VLADMCRPRREPLVRPCRSHAGAGWMPAASLSIMKARGIGRQDGDYQTNEGRSK